jgi:hypothetical protein
VARGLLPAGVDAALLHYRRHAAAATSAAARDLQRYQEELLVLAAARAAGIAAGLLPARSRPLAVRNALLQDAGDDLMRGDRAAVTAKLGFLRTQAPELWQGAPVQLFAVLCRLGAPGRLLVRLARALAVRAVAVPHSR